MARRDIPRDNWRTELDSFSRQHEGWIVRVDVTDASGNHRVEAENLPLQGVSTDSPNNRTVEIMVGEQADDHVTHEIARPVSIAIEQTDGGAERALCIKGDDGSTTVVEFRAPARPEQVDGVPKR